MSARGVTIALLSAAYAAVGSLLQSLSPDEGDTEVDEAGWAVVERRPSADGEHEELGARRIGIGFRGPTL